MPIQPYCTNNTGGFLCSSSYKIMHNILLEGQFHLQVKLLVIIAVDTKYVGSSSNTWYLIVY
jgi:hypothetical protein